MRAPARSTRHHSHAGARWLTLFLGGIPFFIPIVVLFFGAVTLIKKIGERFSSAAATGRSQRMRALLPGLGLGAGLLVIFGVSRLVSAMEDLWLSTADWWAIGYCSAKLVSEGFIAFMPLIASRARAEEAAELGEPPAGAAV